MPQFRKTRRAEEDLLSIATYIAADNMDAAIRWLDGIDRLLQLIVRNPQMEEDVSLLMTGCRRYVFGNYLYST